MDDLSKRINQLARSQVDMVKSVLGKRFTFEDNESNETNGGYTTYGTLKTPTAIVVVRISNHICSMNNWTEKYKSKLIANNKLLRRMGKNLQDPYKERCFYSIVFKAFDYQPNDNGKWKATCKEYVFNPLEVEKNGTIGRIAQDCTKLNASQVISINGVTPIERVSKNPSKNNQQLNCNINMNKKLIRLTESDLHKIVKESVNKVLKESGTQNLGINNYDPTNYDELTSKIKTIMSKVAEIRQMIDDISTSQIDVAQNAGNLDSLAEELYRQLKYTLHKANTNGWVEV